MRVRSLKKLVKGEKGQALAIVMVIICFGSLVLAPVLSHISSGLKIGQEVYVEKMHLLYAADSGVEDGIWEIQNDNLPDKFSGYDPYDYYADYQPYQLSSEVNDDEVAVAVQNVWIPKDIDAPDAEEARQIIEGTEGNPPKLMVFSSLAGASATEYQIKIAFYWENTTERDSLRVQKLGVWLPAGFHYVSGSTNLSGSCAPSSTDVDPYKSGEAVVWNFGSQPQLSVFPGGTSYPMVKTVTFQFSVDSGLVGQKPGAAVSWIDTTGVSGIDYTWDADVSVYAITSTASDENGEETEIEAYAAKIGMRKLGAAIAGDYRAVGDTLLAPTGSADYRNRLYMQNDAVINVGDIPATATVDAAYLYWSGWIDFHYREQYTDQYGQLRWRWGTIPALVYPTTPTQENLTALVETAAMANQVSFGISGHMTQITTHDWQVLASTGEDYEGTWCYNCFYDATDLIRQLIDDELVGSNGSGTYILSHANAVVNLARPGYSTYYFPLYNTSNYTGYPLGTPAHTLSGSGTSYPSRHNYCHGGWSLVIIYSSPETKGHQLYLYDIENPSFVFVEGWGPGGVPDPDFDGDGNAGGLISGFIAPDEIIEEDYAAHLTCFVGEGDEGITGDRIKVNNVSLSNTASPASNVWNSKFPGFSVSGIDIDTFTVAYPTIQPGATSAQVNLPTGSDGFTLIYIILSFRSKVTSGGTLSYLVR